MQRFVARRVDDPHLAADLTADVFLAAIDAAPAYRPERGAPEAWMFGIARNVVSGEHRRARPRAAREARVQGRRLLADDDVARMQERIDAAPQPRAVRGARAAARRRARGLRAAALDGLTPGEAAAALGIRPVTARVRLHRARGACAAGSTMTTRPRPARPMEA